jgi:hypothetical protein
VFVSYRAGGDDSTERNGCKFAHGISVLGERGVRSMRRDTVEPRRTFDCQRRHDVVCGGRTLRCYSVGIIRCS